MNTLLAAPVMLAILLLPISAYASGGAGATGQVTIAGTCGITLGTNTISYGTMTPTQASNSTSNPIVVTNTGTVGAPLFVSGGNWTSGLSPPIIYANETFVSSGGPVHIGQMTPTGPHLNLNGLPVQLTLTLPPASPLKTFWALLAIILTPFAGALTQTVTYTTSC